MPKSKSYHLIFIGFRMLDMTLIEILQSLYIIEPDAMKIWLNLQKAFPPGHFHGLIEDMTGGSASAETMKKLRDELHEVSTNCHREIAKCSERLYVQIRAKDL
jgi:hypothetical protein